MSESDETKWIGRLTDTGRARIESGVDRLNQWSDERPERRGVLDLSIVLYQRDKDAFAAVLGSAIALRLFLFMVPVVVAAVGVVQLFHATGLIGEIAGQTGLNGSVTDQIEAAVSSSSSNGLVLLISGLVLTFWTGRGLAKVLVSTSAAAWQLPARSIKTSWQTIVTITTLMAGLLAANSLLSHARNAGGVALTLGALAASAGVFGLAWFGVSFSAPKATTDPGALLPGSVLFGVTVALLGWWMHFYLPGKIERASATMGSMAFAVATLGYLFFVGRIASSSFVLNAVLWERFGSVSSFVFGLPGIRAIPRRSPKLRAFFDLEHLVEARPDDAAAASDDVGAGEPLSGGSLPAEVRAPAPVEPADAAGVAEDRRATTPRGRD